MIQDHERIVKTGIFENVAYSSVKKYLGNSGKLALTPKNLLVNFRGNPARAFSVGKIRLEASIMNLEVYDSCNRLLLRLIMEDAEQWAREFQDTQNKNFHTHLLEIYEREKKRPEELKKLFSMPTEALKRLYNDTRKERLQFRIRNICFNEDVQELAWHLRNRKLKAFIVAHCYVAWYEWTKGLLYSIYKAKLGKGPKNDEELIKFLSDYPSLGVLSTEGWEIKANQIRNCVAHERFYFDYKWSDLVFLVENKEKRIRLRALESRFASISHTYIELLECLKEKVTKGEISDWHSRWSVVAGAEKTNT
jgi:hypothetical protein